MLKKYVVNLLCDKKSVNLAYELKYLLVNRKLWKIRRRD